MAGPGNTRAKDPDQRRRRNKPAKPKTVSGDGALRGPELPVGVVWNAQTRIWWDNWRRSAQATEFTATDWDFLLDTAMLHTQFWDGDTDVASELRLRVAKAGATLDDRKRLSIKPEDAPKPDARTGSRYGHLRAVPEG